MKKKIDLPKMPWTVRVPVVALYALAVFCVGYAVFLTSSVTAIAEVFLLCFALIFLSLGLGLQRGRTWVAGLLAAGGVLGIGCAVGCSICKVWRAGLVFLLISLPAMLPCLPSARQWLKATSAANPAKTGCVASVAKIVLWVAFVPAAFIVFALLMSVVPGTFAFLHLARYESKEALVAAESNLVFRTFDFAQDGTNYTAIVLKPIGTFASGPAVFVADATGRIIDRCRDYGDNMRFRERWEFSWKNFRKEDVKREESK